MTDQECVRFLQWAAPRLGLRWPGFRKVRRQVRKRIGRRLGQLGLDSVRDYRTYLETRRSEWTVLDRLCRISISRFYRDRGVFDRLRDRVLPALARMALDRNEDRVGAWSAGCASGEEPYTLSILWKARVRRDFPSLGFRQVATDVDPQLLDRARRARYPASSLKDLPAELREEAFVEEGPEHVLRAEFRRDVEFRQQDIRAAAPAEQFHLVLCRNLAMTYFAEDLQRAVLRRIIEHTAPGGFVVIGKLERLPEDVAGLVADDTRLGIYRAGRRADA